MADPSCELVAPRPPVRLTAGEKCILEEGWNDFCWSVELKA